MKFTKGAHTTYYTRYHLVFVTKYRRRALKTGMGAYAIAMLRVVSRWYPDIVIHEAKADEDHVHLLLTIPPSMSVAKAVNLLKTNSAHAMFQKFPFLRRMYYSDDVSLWSPGYFVSTIGANERVIQNYIEHQGEEDRGQAQLDL